MTRAPYKPATPEVFAGIDLGTKCGFAVAGDPPRPAEGWDPSSPIRVPSLLVTSGWWNLARPGNDGERYLAARRAFANMLAIYRPAAVGFELVRRHGGKGKGADGDPVHFDGVQAAHVYGGLRAILLCVCQELGVPVHPHEVAHVKQHATGKGNASKSAMLEAARGAWPTVEIPTDDVADAAWIADRTRSLLSVPF